MAYATLLSFIHMNPFVVSPTSNIGTSLHGGLRCRVLKSPLLNYKQTDGNRDSVVWDWIELRGIYHWYHWTNNDSSENLM